ncbi:hypothetical protein Tco_0132888 [Tanacetum coccineum]
MPMVQKTILIYSTKTTTFHGQVDNDELTDKEEKEVEAGDQAIQTILMGLPEDIYAAEKKAKLFNEWERFNSTEGESIESYYHRTDNQEKDEKQSQNDKTGLGMEKL